MAVDIETRCKNYFYNLNPLAQKFAKDIKNIREAYQDLWDNLSEEKKNEIINENIIAPAAVLKYTHIQNPVSRNFSVICSVNFSITNYQLKFSRLYRILLTRIHGLLKVSSISSNISNRMQSSAIEMRNNFVPSLFAMKRKEIS